MKSNIAIAKQEALRRLQQMEERFQRKLNPNIRKYFSEDRLYYSYLTAGGIIGSIDTISYNPEYENVVREFEERRNKLVYHVIETGNSLALLYVSLPTSDLNREKLLGEWEEEMLSDDNSVLAYVHNFVEPSFSETGYITIDTFADSGALIRIA